MYIKTYESFFSKSDKYKAKWSTKSKCEDPILANGVNLVIGPNVDIDKKLVDTCIEKVKKLAQRYYLFGNCVLLCEIKYKNPLSSHKRHHMSFRLSDIEIDGKSGIDNEIPMDIKREIIKDVRNKFSGYHIDIDEFPDRGYIIFDIYISL